MSLASDLKILYHFAFKPIRGDDHAARLESFYSGQAEGYDDFRKRLLQGREQLYQTVECPAGGTWVDMGGGTAANLEFLGERIQQLGKVYVVDLSSSLLGVAQKRIEARGWNNVETVEADATTFRPPTANGNQTPLADVVTFSYSLTMIPDWFAAIDNALAMLKPGGRIGVVDFFVSRKYASEPVARHRWFTRTFWPTWFANDNVFLSPDHVPYLQRQLQQELFEQHRAKVPYMPLVRVPYYRFIGRKTHEPEAQARAKRGFGS
jgi:S-adenosylmethionine-diacylgycerolhomoserine-N-methlytransferase